MDKECCTHGRIRIIRKGFLLENLKEKQLRRLGAVEGI